MTRDSSEIRVLEAITPSRIGGAEVFVIDACKKLRAMDAHVGLFCPAGRPFVGYAEERGIAVTTWKTHGKLDPVTLARLTRLIQRERYNVIHTHLSTASLLGSFAARLAGVPSVAHVHGLNSATCYRYSTLLIAVSQSVKNHLISQGVDEKRIRVAPNGVDLARFTPSPSADAKYKLGYDPQTPLFGVFGRLSPEKGQRCAVEALFLLRKDYPNAQLILAGEGGDLGDLKTTADALGIAEYLHFPGFQADVTGLMCACDAVIVPSLKEGFGLAAIEAMALAKPVVASRVGGLSEIVVPGETGYLISPNDSPAIARALGELIEDKSAAAKMGEAARKRVEDRFDQNNQMALVHSILREATEC